MESIAELHSTWRHHGSFNYALLPYYVLVSHNVSRSLTSVSWCSSLCLNRACSEQDAIHHKLTNLASTPACLERGVGCLVNETCSRYIHALLYCEALGKYGVIQISKAS